MRKLLFLRSPTTTTMMHHDALALVDLMVAFTTIFPAKLRRSNAMQYAMRWRAPERVLLCFNDLRWVEVVVGTGVGKDTCLVRLGSWE